MISRSFQTVRRMREAWKWETYVRSQSFSSESAVKYLHVERRKIQISPPLGEQDQSNALPRANKDNQIPTPFLASPRRHNIDRCITKHMSSVKRDEICLREFIVRRHQFQLKRRIEKKPLKNRMKERACQEMSFADWFWKVSSPNGLLGLLARRKKWKCCLTHVINDKIEVEAIYNFWRFLVEEFFLPVIKPAWNLL